MGENKRDLLQDQRVFQADMSRARGAREAPYNPDNGLIALEGPNGDTLLANYVGESYPDPNSGAYLTFYNEDYVRLEPGKDVPSQRPADVKAWCVEVPNLMRNDLPPEPGTPIGINKKTSGPHYREITAGPKTGNVVDQTGVAVTEHSVSVSDGNAGFAMAGGTIRMRSETYEQPTTEQKGLMKESPLTGLIPSTLITFFVTDFLPNINFIMKMRAYVQIILQMPSIYEGIKRLAEYEGGDTSDWPRAGTAEQTGRGFNDAIGISGNIGIDDNEFDGRNEPVR